MIPKVSLDQWESEVTDLKRKLSDSIAREQEIERELESLRAKLERVREIALRMEAQDRDVAAGSELSRYAGLLLRELETGGGDVS